MFISALFGSRVKRKAVNFRRLVLEGALIIDLRSPAEFRHQHVLNSINVPLDALKKELDWLAGQHKVIITCCERGQLSRMAERYLSQAGVKVYDGGVWRDLEKKLSVGV